MSFAIEPIQLPIVPLSLLSLHSLRTTAGASARRRRPVPSMGCAAAAQNGAQSLEVRELAELRRQRAIHVIRRKCPATAPRCCAATHIEYPSPKGTQAALHGTAVPQYVST